MKTEMIAPTGLTALVLALNQTLAQPTLTMQPTDLSVSLQAVARFNVGAQTSGGPLTFRWWFNDAALDPATHPSAARASLSLSNVTETMAGSYWAVVTDNNGSATSRVAVLDVDRMFEVIHLSPDKSGNTVAEGCSWGDADGDGKIDLFVSRNGGPEVANVMYRNLGEGLFSRVTNAATLPGPWTFGGSAWADYDNSGALDLFVGETWSYDRLCRNDGRGAFSVVSSTVFAHTVHNGTSRSAAWADYDLDGHVDLFIARDGDSPVLLRNEGGARFTRIVDAVFTHDPLNAQGSSWCDYDADGYPDLCVAEYGGTRLYHNEGGGSFSRVTTGPVVTDSRFSMGCAWGDYDNDGWPDLFVTRTESRSNALYKNNGDGTFTLLSTSPVAAPKTASSSGGIWGDYDNDGYLDLFVGNGYGSEPGEKSFLFLNDRAGGFTRILTGSPANDRFPASGSAWGDYDDDGFLDLAVVNTHWDSHTFLYRNRRNGNHWLKVDLVGTASNRSAIGAKVRVKATLWGRSVWQLREVSGGSGYASQGDLRPNFGLGDATVAEVIRVEWPSGNVQEYTDQSVDRLMKITEVARITPARPTASLGGSVTLRSVSGTGTYQWRFHGADLAGETKATLTLTNLQAAHQGGYSVVVTATDGTVRTNFAYLIVDPTFTKVAVGPVVEETDSGWACSWADYDDDGDLDLLVGNGVEATKLELLGLFRNDGKAGFARLTNEVGSLAATPGKYAGGVWGDYDNNGALDCLVMDWTQTTSSLKLHRSTGNGQFELAAAAPLTDTLAGYASWVDYDNDGWLDVFNAYGWSEGGVPTNHLFRGTGAGAFAQVLDGPVARDRFVGVEASAWGDYDGDGDMDLLVIDMHAWEQDNARYPNYLYRNDGGGLFTRVTTNTIARTRTMSLVPAWADYDNDSKLDLFISGYNEPGRLYHNEGGGEFSVQSMGPGPQAGQPAWGDFDNDGDLDLYVTRGQGSEISNLFYRNNGDGSFTLTTLGSPAQDLARSGSCVWGDYDGDGFLDLFVANNRGGSDCLYRNNGNANTWLVVRLKGTVSNRAALGAKVRVYARVQGRMQWQLRELTGGSRCQGDLRAHFGLDAAPKAMLVRIEWPSGTVQELSNVPANQILTVTEPPALQALGEGRIRVLCWARQSHEVEVSDDLQTWTSLGVVATDQHRPVVLDPGAVGKPHRFYRAKGQ